MLNKDLRSIVGRNIKAERIRAGLTQEKTAELLQVTRRQYINYETDYRIDSVTLWKLSNIFKCDMNRFFMDLDFTNSEM